MKGFFALNVMGYKFCSGSEITHLTLRSPPLFKGTTDKSLLETKQVCVAMAGDWSAAMAGRKTVKDSVRVRKVQI